MLQGFMYRPVKGQGRILKPPLYFSSFFDIFFAKLLKNYLPFTSQLHQIDLDGSKVQF